MSVTITRGLNRRFVVTVSGVKNEYLPVAYGQLVRGRLVEYLLRRAEWRRMQALEAAVRSEYPVPEVLAQTNQDDLWYENASLRLENAEKQAEAAANVTAAQTALTTARTVLAETLFPGTWRYFIGLETAYGALDPLTTVWVGQQPDEIAWVGNYDWKCRVGDGVLEVARYT